MKVLSQPNSNSHIAAAIVAVLLFISSGINAEDIIGPMEATDLLIDPWVPPDTESEGFYPLDTIVGKTITFSWTDTDGLQDVWIHPTGDCNPEGSIFVGPETSGATTANYTFTETDGSIVGTNVFFTSQIDNHCSEGQQISIRIFSTQQDFEVVQSGGVASPGSDGQVTADGDGAGEEGPEDSSAGTLSFKSTSDVVYLTVALMGASIGLLNKVMD